MNDELTKDRFDEMVLLAQSVLLDYGCYTFPVNVYGLANKIGMSLIPYSTLAPRKRERLLGVQGTERGLTISEVSNGNVAYCTYYNDDYSEAARRYTIAHEIKHIVSGDIEKSEDSFTDKDECLANYFAKCLLAPQSIIITRGYRTKEEYVEHFGISYDAAEIWHQTTEKRKYCYGAHYLFDYEKPFIKEIQVRSNG